MIQALITKLHAKRLAVAATATLAPEAQKNGATVAEVAGVAVAKPQTSKIVIERRPGWGAGQPSVDGERLKGAMSAFQSSPFGNRPRLSAGMRLSGEGSVMPLIVLFFTPRGELLLAN